MKFQKLLLALLLLVPLKTLPASNELDCLIRNVYYEAKSEPRAGKIAVALVTLNRVHDKRYPKSICGVVYQRNQFSWTKKYKSSAKINAAQWKASKEAALEALMNPDYLGRFYATHFHAKYVSPGWKLKRVASIGGHIFYM